MYHYKTSGLSNVWLRNGYKIKNTKHGEAVAIENLEGLHRAIAEDIVCARRPIKPEEFRFLRIELGLSQKALAQLFDTTDQTIANYEKGNTSIPRPTDVLLRSYYDNMLDESCGLRQLLTDLADIDNQLDELERNWQFEMESAGDWHTAAA
jgi:DNA-binding transcriptional regulator YiaG